MQIFICYNHESDQSFIDELTATLKENNIIPQIRNLKLEFGEDLVKNIDIAIRGCEQVIAVISNGFTKSKWHQKELFALLVKEQKDERKFIIPILREDCEYSPLLEDRIVDFRNKTFKQGFKLLVKRIS